MLQHPFSSHLQDPTSVSCSVPWLCDRTGRRVLVSWFLILGMPFHGCAHSKLWKEKWLPHPLRLFTNAKILGLLLWERPLPYSSLICQGLRLLVLYVQSTCPGDLRCPVSAWWTCTRILRVTETLYASVFLPIERWQTTSQDWCIREQV